MHITQVSIGYAVELALGFFLAASMLLIRQRSGRRWEFFQIIIKKGLEAFFEFAVYFAVAIQLATTIMLVKKDFGKTTDDFGANEAQNALAIAVVCVIPLVYPIVLLHMRIFHPESGRQHAIDRKTGEAERKHNLRLILFCIVVVLFFYPFLSQCIHNWAPIRMGEGADEGGQTMVTHGNWTRIEGICFEKVEKLRDVEYWLLALCEIVASLLIFLFALWHAWGVGLRRWKEEDKFSGKESKVTAMVSKARDKLESGWHGHRIMLLFVPVALGAAILWCILRLREMQAIYMGEGYQGNDWGFGQIVGIIIFAPVVVDMGFAAWSARSLLGWGDYDAISSRESF